MVANRLARSSDDVPITLVDAHGDHLFQAGFLSLPFGGNGVPVLERDTRGLLASDVELVVASARQIDAAARVVHLEGGAKIRYGVLVIATGARNDHHQVEGYHEGAHNFHCRRSAVRLQEALRDFRGGDIVVGATRLPYRCPPSPLEFVLLLEEHLRKTGRREQARLTYVYPLDRIYPAEPVARMMEPILRDRGIRIEVPFPVERVDAARRRVRSSNGRELPYDLLVLVPPHTGAPVVREAGLAGPAGWVPVDRETLRVADRVFALGDAADLPLPKSGSAAHFQSAVAADNALAAVRGCASTTRYDGHVT